MPAQTACVHCKKVGFVRRERVVTSAYSATEYYCGRCNQRWSFASETRDKNLPRAAIIHDVIAPGVHFPTAMPQVPHDAPAACPKCGAFGTVKLESTHKGASTALMWICKRCDYEWPVKATTAA